MEVAPSGEIALTTPATNVVRTAAPGRRTRASAVTGPTIHSPIIAAYSTGAVGARVALTKFAGTSSTPDAAPTAAHVMR